MTPGQPTADLIWREMCGATATVAQIVRDETDERELRAALAALSVFRGPGTVARNFCIQIIRDELADRQAVHHDQA